MISAKYNHVKIKTEKDICITGLPGDGIRRNHKFFTRYNRPNILYSRTN